MGGNPFGGIGRAYRRYRRRVLAAAARSRYRATNRDSRPGPDGDHRPGSLPQSAWSTFMTKKVLAALLVAAGPALADSPAGGKCPVTGATAGAPAAAAAGKCPVTGSTIGAQTPADQAEKRE